jgi:tetratricopeptide (TPR) repeat protein
MESVVSGVRKRVVTRGDGEGPVGRGATISIKYALSVKGADAPFDSSDARRGGLLKFKLGRRKALPGLELLAETMEVGEVSEGELDASRAYGDAGLPRCGVSGGETIVVSLTMVAATPAQKAKGMAEMTSAERFVEAGTCKERGNALFKEAKIEKAAAEYQQCLRFIEYVFYKPRAAEISNASSVTGDEEDGDVAGQGGEKESVDGGEELEGEKSTSAEEEPVEEVDATVEVSSARGAAEASAPAEPKESDEEKSEGAVADRGEEGGFVEAETEEPTAVEPAAENDPSEQEVRELHVVCLNNLVLCLLKLGENKRAAELATISARLDPTNHKPLFYRGRARHAMGDWDDAKADLYAAAKLAPRNMGVRIELDKLTKKMKLHKAQERSAAKAMFG